MNRTKTPKIDASRLWLAMDYHTRKHLLRALAAAKRAVRLERKDYAELMEARRDDERITWQGLWQTRKGIDAMQRTVAEIERMFALAELANKPDNAWWTSFWTWWTSMKTNRLGGLSHDHAT